MKKLLLAVFTAVISLVFLWQTVLARQFPQPANYVNDFANIISPAAETALNNQLKVFEDSTTNQISVVTLVSLEGDTVENVAIAIFDQWGIGQKDKDNGVLLLIASQDKKIRIEVGYGLESVLTDSRSGAIIRDLISPAFKQGDYDTGISQGVAAIIKVISEDPTAFDQPESSTASSVSLFSLLPTLIIFILIYSVAFLGRSKRYWPGGIISAAVGFFLGLAASIFTALFFAVFLGLIGLFFDYIFSKNYKSRKSRGLPTGFWSSKGGFSSGRSSSGSSSFGGFGGGSSGGGGASGGW